MDSKPLILVFSDSPTANTGFGTVNKQVFRRLKDKYTLVFLGINFDGSPLPGAKEFNIYPTVTDPYGRDKLHPLLLAYKPDLLYTLNDYDSMTWVPAQLTDVRTKLQKDIPWVFYTPVDGKPVYKKYIEFMKTYVEVPFTVTKFGQDAILEQDPDFKVPYVYHGVDHNMFQKLDPDRPLVQDGPTVNSEKARLGIDKTFNILMIGVNQIRKQYNIALEAFAEFSKDKADARLILHCARNTSYGWDMDALISYLSDKNESEGKQPINKKIVFTNGIVGALGIAEQELALLYNYADVFLNTSCGEGFGLPVVEAMASELPLIVHDSTAMPELTGDTALKVKTAYEYIFPFQDRTLSRPIPDKNGIVEHLETLYADKKLRETLGKKARERIISDVRFSWDYCAQEVDKKIQEGLQDSRILDLSEQEIL